MLVVFREDDWPEVAKYTMIYGIQALNENYELRKLTLYKLEHILKQNHVFQTIEENIPVIEQKINEIKHNIDSFTGELDTTNNNNKQPQRG